MIQVTKTYLPDFDKYIATLKRAWDKQWITNNGELVQELELSLKNYLGVKHLLFCNNGTIVLQMALKAFNVTKEVITTPFSYVATTNSILWEGAVPKFVDIDPVTFCIDANKIEAAITEETQAILATHVYGIPCDIEKIEFLAAKYNLKVIYDGAHGFGCEYKGKSLLSYGDISTCSFHATKIFHTVEGGCIITNNDEVARKLFLYRQFGHIGDEYFSVGINGKSSEFHAAMGISVLPDIDKIIVNRKERFDFYNENLDNRIYKVFYKNFINTKLNYSYYPVIFDSEEVLLTCFMRLKENSIFARRYFYPSLNNLPYIDDKQFCPVSDEVSKKILCLPMYYDLGKEEMQIIVNVVNSCLVV